MLMVAFDEALRFALTESSERRWLEAVEDEVSIESIETSDCKRASLSVGLRERSIGGEPYMLIGLPGAAIVKSFMSLR